MNKSRSGKLHVDQSLGGGRERGRRKAKDTNLVPLQRTLGGTSCRILRPTGAGRLWHCQIVRVGGKKIVNGCVCVVVVGGW